MLWWGGVFDDHVNNDAGCPFELQSNLEPIVHLQSAAHSGQNTVDGMPVRFMYRERPDNDLDSGWRFFAGGETDEYIDNPANSGVYDVNTIANYDPDIIPHLEAPEGSAFERDDADQPFVEVFDFKIGE
jgi:hypothetical protein